MKNSQKPFSLQRQYYSNEENLMQAWPLFGFLFVKVFMSTSEDDVCFTSGNVNSFFRLRSWFLWCVCVVGWYWRTRSTRIQCKCLLHVSYFLASKCQCQFLPWHTLTRNEPENWLQRHFISLFAFYFLSCQIRLQSQTWSYKYATPKARSPGACFHASSVWK